MSNDSTRGPSDRNQLAVVTYARVSTQEQVRSGISLESQQEKLRQWAACFDHKVVAEVVDSGESGKDLKRPGIRIALGLLRSGQADALTIVKLDRLTRCLGDWQTLISGYFDERAGKQLVSLSESVNTSTAAGRMVLNVILSFAQMEREQVAERTRDALQYKLANNQRAGEVRYGWDLLDDGITLVRNEAEQAVIARVLALRPMSYRKIADHLNETGVPTKKRGKWSHSVVASICNRAAQDERRKELVR